jgi:hypothetical protein
MSIGSEVGHLCVLIEWINQNQVNSIVVQAAMVWPLASSHKCKMATALDSEPFGIKSNIFKLIELEEANELFIWCQAEDKAPGPICLQGVL